MDNEEWRNLVVDDNKSTKYDVSNCGRIRNRITGKVLNPSPGKNGYIAVRINNKTRNLHRLVLSTFLPPDSDDFGC